MSRSLRVVLTIGLVLVLASLSTQHASADGPLRIRITELDVSRFPEVHVVASVVDAQEKPVADITARDLIASEEGRTQSPSIDLATESIPLYLALVLDTSGSMAGQPLADAKDAMTQLIRSLDAKDAAAVLTFNTRVTVAQELTQDKDALVGATKAAVSGGDTAILDGAMAAMDVLAGAPAGARRGIILLTDGIDNSSHVSLQDVGTRIATAGYPMYTVGLGANLDRPRLQALADASRGQAFVAPTSAQLASIYAALGERILTQYVVSYTSNVRKVDPGTVLTLQLQIARAGTVLGSVKTTFTVPDGHGIAPRGVASVPPTLTPTVAREPATDIAPYSAEVVGLLGSASALSLLLWLFVLTTTQSLDDLQRRRVAALAGADQVEVQRVARRSFGERIVAPALGNLGRRFSRVGGAGVTERTRRRLAQAGDPLELAALEFLGLQLASTTAFGVFFAAGGALTITREIGWVLLFALLGALVGILVPNIWLDRTTKSRRRKILRALPSALDMLALSARAGMTFDGALAQVVQRWDSPLSDEFRRVLAEFRMGRDRRETLRAMADRTAVADVARFVNAVVQADALGVPIASVLTDQAVEMRTRRRQRAEEAARIAPVKMLFPMVGLIFPALFVVILGPAVPRFIQIFAVH